MLRKLHPSLSAESILIVSIQSIGIAFLLLTGPWIAKNLFLIFAEAVGVFMIGWGFVALRKSRFSILPNVHHESSLITDRPYEIVRHPMYAGILLTMLVLVIDHFTMLRMIVFLIVAADLFFKVHLEEILLEKHFGEEYVHYKKKTHRLVPYVY